MSLQFLSNEWFDRVMALRADAEATLGDAGLPVEVRSVKLNISVPHASGEKQFAISGGEPQLGHIADADTRVIVEYDVARRLFLDGDISAGVQAFMAGQIRIEGDMTRLLLLQQHLSSQPSAGQMALREKVVGFTRV